MCRTDRQTDRPTNGPTDTVAYRSRVRDKNPDVSTWPLTSLNLFARTTHSFARSLIHSQVCGREIFFYEMNMSITYSFNTLCMAIFAVFSSVLDLGAWLSWGFLSFESQERKNPQMKQNRMPVWSGIGWCVLRLGKGGCLVWREDNSRVSPLKVGLLNVAHASRGCYCGCVIIRQEGVDWIVSNW